MSAPESLRVSAKSLGDALPDACLRCLWVSLHFNIPYQRFPGVFSTIDRFIKRAVHTAFDRQGRLPVWFPDIGPVTGYERELSYRRFRVRDPDTGVVLRGSPDDVFRMANGSYHIVDYKTAKLTEGQAEYLPIYEVQLNAYAYLAERIGLSPVRGLSLLYMQPNSDRDEGSETGPALPFEATRIQVELKPDALIPLLLKKTQDSYRLPVPPASKDECEDCARLDLLVRSLSRRESGQ